MITIDNNMITMKTIRAPKIDRTATSLNTRTTNNTKTSKPRRADLLHAPEPPKCHVACGKTSIATEMVM